MSEPRRHHIIAETYQKSFSKDGRLVAVFDKSTGKAFVSQPKNIGVQRGINDGLQEDLSVDKVTAESFFSGFEGKYPTNLAKVASGHFEDDCLTFFTQFMMLQASRSPALRRLTSKIIQSEFAKNPEAYIADLKPHEIHLLKLSLSGDDASEMMIGLHATKDLLTGIAAVLDRLNYRFVKIDSPVPLCTCDTPVVYFGVTKNRGKLTATPPTPNRRVLCFFPISSRFFLFGDTQSPPLPILPSNASFQRTDILGISKRWNQVAAMNAERHLVGQDEQLVNSAAAAIPRGKTTPKKFFESCTTLARHLVKLNDPT